MSKENSPHILNSSANLLGICFLILTSIQVLKLKEATIIDDVLAFAILLFMASCILSFLSMSRKQIVHKRYELIAEYFFRWLIFYVYNNHAYNV